MLIKNKFEGYSPSGERVLPILDIFGRGGGGTSTSTTAPEQWVTDIAKDIAGRATTLTDINTNPYVRYPGQRVAPFTKLQEDAFARAGGLEPSQLGEQAGQMAGAATMGALGTGYDPYQMGQFTAGRAAQYMNPFVEMAMAPQLREAQRTSDIQRTAEQAAATRSGAFGGSRQAIVEAERQRNLGQQLGDIRARGYMSAFDQAQQQFAREQQLREQSRQYGAGLGLQGLQTALTGAGVMGSLGGQQFAQAKDVAGLQFGLGKEQQQLGQRMRDIDYQDFLSAERYPYQQLEFMSNIMRGTPMGTVQTLYQPPASTATNIASLGLGAAGLSRLFGAKEGGAIKEYAIGGSVTSDRFIADALDSLSDNQLAQAREAAAASGDRNKLELIDAELADRERRRAAEERSIQAGLGSAFNQIPYDSQERMMAGGGIVAFSNGGNSSSDDGDSEVDSPLMAALQAQMGGPGDPATYRQLSSMLPGVLRSIASQRPVSEPTKEEEESFITNYIKKVRGDASETPYASLRQDLESMKSDQAKALRQGEGIALLQASAEMAATPGSLGRAFAAGARVALPTYSAALDANRREKRAIANMQFNIDDAERKERMGMRREALTAMSQAQRDKAAANKFAMDKANLTANVLIKGIQATRPGAVKSGGKPSLSMTDYENTLQYKLATEQPKEGENKAQFQARMRSEASAEAQGRARDVGPGRLDVMEQDVRTRVEKDVRTFMDSWNLTDSAERRQVKELEKQARKASGPEKEQLQAQAIAIKNRVENEARGRYYHKYGSPAPSAASSAAPSTAPAPSGKVMTMADVIATAVARRLPVEQVRADAIKAGYTIR